MKWTDATAGDGHLYDLSAKKKKKRQDNRLQQAADVSKKNELGERKKVRKDKTTKH